MTTKKSEPQRHRGTEARHRVLWALCLCGAFLVWGCGPKQKEVAKWTPPPARPAGYVPPAPAAVDPALTQLAWYQLELASQASDQWTRAHAVEAYKQIGGNNARGPVLRALKDKAAVVRFAGAMAAGELRLKEAYPDLVALANDPNRNVRVGVRYALHRLGDVSRSHDLEKYAVDPDHTVRANTAMVLGLLDDTSALKILRAMANDKSIPVRLQVAEAQWRLGELNGLTDLVTAAVSKYPDDQIVAMLAIAGPKDQRVVEHVRGGMTADYPEVELVAARAMGMLGSDEGWGLAASGAKSKDPRQRSLAALAFGSIGRADAQPTLAELMKDFEQEVRLAAATAQLQIRDNGSVAQTAGSK